jgi:hypothetical protein
MVSMVSVTTPMVTVAEDEVPCYIPVSGYSIVPSPSDPSSSVVTYVIRIAIQNHLLGFMERTLMRTISQVLLLTTPRNTRCTPQYQHTSTIAHHRTPSHTIAHHRTPSHTIAHHRTPSHTIAHHRTPSHTIAHHRFIHLTLFNSGHRHLRL